MKKVKVKIETPNGYKDRFGVMHGFGSIALLPESIANKVVHHRLGSFVSRPMAAPEEDSGWQGLRGEEPEIKPPPKKRGRPPKKK